MLTGIASLLGVLTNRLGRIIDRARALEDRLIDVTGEHKHVMGSDLNMLARRARYINHACAPNCWFQVVDTTIWIRASKFIAAGEELTYDYATVGDHTIQCRCRPGCPTRL